MCAIVKHKIKASWATFHWLRHSQGFPHNSGGKEFACNAGDPSSISGWGRYAGEGIGSPLQYSWASLVSQLVKNPPAMQETWVWSLGWEGPLEKGKATHSSILAWRIPCTILVHIVERCEESDVTEWLSLNFQGIHTIYTTYWIILVKAAQRWMFVKKQVSTEHQLNGYAK